MSCIGILGAGETGATLARRLAETGRFRSLWLVDPDLGRAKGKALDLLQSGPGEGYDTLVSGAERLEDLPPLQALVVTEAAGLPRSSPGALPPESFVRPLVAAVGAGFLLDATAEGAALVAAAIRLGLPRAQVAGSLPLATAAALRTLLAEDLQAAARDVSLTILGQPPVRTILPRGSAALGGAPIERLSPLAERRALERLGQRVPGPVSLATAAARVLLAVFGRTPAVRPVFAGLDGEYGQRRSVVAVPARLGLGRLQGVVEIPLDPVDRAAFDTLAERASFPR